MRVLLIDNHDSYTFNIFNLISSYGDTQVDVVVNDDPCLTRIGDNYYDAAVISPGPGNPCEEEDFGLCSTILTDHPQLPVLGVCLGHQGIGAQYGATITAAPQPRHGHLSQVTHADHELFMNIPSPFTAVRYHSLHIAEPLPDELEVLACAEDGVVMAVGHRTLPRWGVQFHPESISTSYGESLLANFLNLARRTIRGRKNGNPPTQSARLPIVQTLPQEADPALLALWFNQRFTQWIWLDSSQVIQGLSRYSIFAPATDTHTEVLTYNTSTDIGAPRTHISHAGDHVTTQEQILPLLQSRLRTSQVDTSRLPFPFKGGYIGFLGYEMKADCGMHSRHISSRPDAVWVRVDQFVLIDHETHQIHLVTVRPAQHQETETPSRWLAELAEYLAARPRGQSPAAPSSRGGDGEPEAYARPRADYITAVKRAQDQLRAGNSYEVCLTNTLRLPQSSVDPFDHYLALRERNPAPYAAFLRLSDLVVSSSSPEQFLRVSADGVVSSKPIKGTAPRSDDPNNDRNHRNLLINDPKTFAENLMIVDLVRNDLSRVCYTGSIHVPSYMAVESYATVHQLVSTIRGQLLPEYDAIDAITAAFPPGSMTGAPKLRTTDIIDILETEARGIYSGVLGYLSYDGAADLNVVIRTAVSDHRGTTVGAGGAIVLDSDPTAEYEEMLLKAQALVDIFAPTAESVDI